MKIFLFCVMAFSITSTAIAQEIQIGDGKKTILIDVGGGSNSSNQEARIRLLERAVRDLQNQVFQLSMKQQQPAASANLYICEAQAFTKKYKSEKQALEYDAREQVKERCISDNNHEMHCARITCKKIN